MNTFFDCVKIKKVQFPKSASVIRKDVKWEERTKTVKLTNGNADKEAVRKEFTSINSRFITVVDRSYFVQSAINTMNNVWEYCRDFYFDYPPPRQKLYDATMNMLGYFSNSIKALDEDLAIIDQNIEKVNAIFKSAFKTEYNELITCRDGLYEISQKMKRFYVKAYDNINEEVIYSVREQNLYDMLDLSVEVSAIISDVHVIAYNRLVSYFVEMLN
ncbi:MAG: hypothetical protein FWD23_11840 [Oscillospiraceae bacterium]|nr:hypothetical protein [Oscillospiraceae bacterium]